MPEQREQPTYEEQAPSLLKNMDKFLESFYASRSKMPENGQTGQENAAFAALAGVKKIGLEGIIGSLESQLMKSIQAGDGLKGEFSLPGYIAETSKAYIQSAVSLKVEDLAKYIKDTLKIDVVIKDRYKNKIVGELLNSEDEADKKYGNELMEQLKNGVMSKGTAIAYKERADRINAEIAREA